MPCEYMPSGLPNSRGAITLGIAPLLAGSGEPDVFEVDRLAVDATRGRGDPVGELTPLGHRLHQALDVRLVPGPRQPRALSHTPPGLGQQPAPGRHPPSGRRAHLAGEGAVRPRERGLDPEPPRDPDRP